MEKDFCLSALDRALIFSNPEIFNTDQGSQFTSTDFTGRLERNGIAISMDGRGRAYSTIFSLSACGGLSSMRRYIYTTTKTSEKPGWAFHSTSVFIIQSVFIPQYT